MNKKVDIDEMTRIFRSNILKERDRQSLKNFIDYCVKILSGLEKKGSLLNNNLKGELGEIVIETLILDLQKIMKIKNIDSLVLKNAVLLNRGDNGKVYSTEIDLCMVTEYRVYLFEVKCYKGNKTLSKECYLKGESSIDIYGQSKYHLEMFDKVFDDCRYKYTQRDKDIISPYKLLFFNLSCDSIKDKREDKWKDIIPLLEYYSFYEWFKTELNNSSLTKYKQWDLEKLKNSFELLDKNRDILNKFHIDRMKSRTKRRNKNG